MVYIVMIMAVVSYIYDILAEDIFIHVTNIFDGCHGNIILLPWQPKMGTTQLHNICAKFDAHTHYH